MSEKYVRAKAIERRILTVFYVLYGIGINGFLLFFDGDYEVWERIVNLIPLCIMFTAIIFMYILDLKGSNGNVDTLYNLALGFGMGSGISISLLAFLIFTYAGALLSFFAGIPVLFTLIDLTVWRCLKKHTGEQVDDYSGKTHTPIFIAVHTCAAVLLLSVIYVVIESSIGGELYNLLTLCLLIPIIVVPFVLSVKKKKKTQTPTAFLCGITIGANGFLGCTPIMNCTIMGGIGAVIICIVLFYSFAALLTYCVFAKPRHKKTDTVG